MGVPTLARQQRGQQQATQAVFVTAPQGGINALSGAGAVPEQDAIFLTNLIPQEYGCHVRKGYVEWCQPLPAGTLADGVKTLIPVSGQNSDTPVDKLFACTSEGIYDITTQGAAPVLKLTWPLHTARSGWVSWHAYTTLAGQFILACDTENGYYVYTVSTDTWAVGVITGPTPSEAALDFVTVWKNRVWFVQQSTGSAWYLPVGQITGSATEFQFGNKFKYGGYLKSLWNWTLDGGEGVDDYLAVISSGGDMLIYKGEDPATAGEFRQVGAWYIGKPTQGRRQGDDLGGDLYLLSVFGILQPSKLIAGSPLQNQSVQLSYKINPRINNILDEGNQTYGWQIKFSPVDQLLFLIVPRVPGQPYRQFVYSIATQAWCQFANVPMKCGDIYKGKFMFGSDENRVFMYTGAVDNVLVEDNGASSTNITWEMLTGFQTYNTPANWKRVHFLRPRFIGAEIPTYNVAARYDFDLSFLPMPYPSGNMDFGRWNNGHWDGVLWAGEYLTSQYPMGGSGMGQHIAIAMRGQSAGGTIYLGTDLLMDSGGYL
jgi:hypothetical protein